MPSYCSNIDVDIDEILENCSRKEIIRDVIPWLIHNEYITEDDILEDEIDLRESDFDIACKHLIGKKHLLKKEEEEFIIKLSNNL